MTTDQSPSTGDEQTKKPDPYASGEIVARAGRYYRNARFIMAVLLIGMGGWFAYDGWIGWPEENRKIDLLKRQQADAQKANNADELGRINTELKKHEFRNDSSILLQKVLACTLPPLAVMLLVWTVRNSRGEYRLSGTKVSIPGHPTIDFSEITAVNNDLWDRKGIAWVKYKTSSGEVGEFKLDDFVYDRPPTDAIYDRIARHMGLDEDEDEDDEEDDDGRDDRDQDEQPRESSEKQQA